MIISWLNQGTESSVKTEINKDIRGTLNQVYDWIVIHDFSSETCVDGKMKVFFFSTWSKIRTNSPFLKTCVMFSKILSNERCTLHLSQAISVVIHPKDSYELSLSVPRSALIFKHFFIKELFTLRNSSCVQTRKRAYFHARFSLLSILPW